MNSFLLKSAKKPCDGFAGGAYHLANFFVGEGQLCAEIALTVVVLGAPIARTKRASFSAAECESLMDFIFRQSVMVVFAQMLRHSKSHFAVLAQEIQEIIAAMKFAWVGSSTSAVAG